MPILLKLNEPYAKQALLILTNLINAPDSPSDFNLLASSKNSKRKEEASSKIDQEDPMLAENQTDSFGLFENTEFLRKITEKGPYIRVITLESSQDFLKKECDMLTIKELDEYSLYETLIKKYRTSYPGLWGSFSASLSPETQAKLSLLLSTEVTQQTKVARRIVHVKPKQTILS